MQRSPTYEELAQRVRALEEERQWREKVEAILRESEQKWRSLVEKQAAELKKEIIQRKQAEDRIGKLKQELEQSAKNRTEELENTLAEIKKLDKLKDSFLSSVSHEFRAPLTSIRSFSEILLEYENEDPKTRKEFLHIINSESERLSRLVDDLLDLSQIESGRMVYNDDLMSVEEVIREVSIPYSEISPIDSRSALRSSRRPRGPRPDEAGDREPLAQCDPFFQKGRRNPDSRTSYCEREVRQAHRMDLGECFR